MKTSLYILATLTLAFTCSDIVLAQGKADIDPQPPTPAVADGIICGYEYVDLGLPSGTLWATHNIGAESPQEAGSFFAWGEIEPRESFVWENYQYFIDYVIDPNNGAWYDVKDIGEDICGTEYDAARQIWGGGWRLPNETERYELRMRCWSKWVTENGMNGLRVYGPNSHSIFIPAGGSLYENMPDFAGARGYIWTGIADTDKSYTGHPIIPSNSAKVLEFDSSVLQSGKCARSLGTNIRPVINRKELTAIEPITTTNQQEAIYNLQGQRLNSQPEHGVYIKGGKKIILK